MKRERLLRHIHGWVHLDSDCIFLGLDSEQFHFYQIARVLAEPPGSEHPGRFNLSSRDKAILLRCGNSTVSKVEKELIAMGLLKRQGNDTYVVNINPDPLHNHKLAIEQVLEFLQTQKGTEAPLNPTPRRIGKRRTVSPGGSEQLQTTTPLDTKLSKNATVTPGNSPDRGTVTPGNSTVTPGNSPDRGTVTPGNNNKAGQIAVEDKKNIEEERSTLRGDSHPDSYPVSSFSSLAKKLSTAKNKVGVLIDAFKLLHPNAPPEDMNGLGGRLAGMCKPVNYEYLLAIIWDTSSIQIHGSHLDYIAGRLRKERSGTYRRYTQEGGPGTGRNIPTNEQLEAEVEARARSP